MPDTCVLMNERALGPPGAQTKSRYMCITARQERKLRQKQLGPQIIAMCYVYVCVCVCVCVCARALFDLDL